MNLKTPLGKCPVGVDQNIANREVGTNQQINSVTFDESKVFPKFGYYALALLKPTLVAMAPATTVAIVNKSRFEELEIPLPPLTEQKRIAAILDRLCKNY